MARKTDTVSLVAGVLVAGFGVILLLDATGALSLHMSALGPLAALIVGATLLAGGLSRRG
ncbi:MAG: hypothetical protein ACJ76Z_03935 [Thermoleophilaceae bacterium]